MYLILCASVNMSLPRAHPCLEADFIMRELPPYSLLEGEEDVAFWNRGVVQPSRRDPSRDLVKMLPKQAEQKLGDS